MQTNAIDIDDTIRQVLYESDSDVEGRPLHEPIIREACRRLRRRGVTVSQDEVEERLLVLLGEES